jgi:hypothetical protein
MLEEHKAPWLHTTDAVTLNHPYEGWNETRRDQFLSACVKVIEGHMAFQRMRSYPGRLGLAPCTVTVVLKDFVRARASNPDIPKTAEEICATSTLYRCLEWGSDIMQADFYHLFFDQGEPFRGHVLDRLKNKKARKHLSLIEKVIDKGESDMRCAPALQMADLVAWCMSHKNRAPRYRWQNRLLGHNWIDNWLTYDDLINPIQSTVSLVKTWRLPPRRPTR